MLFNLSEHPSIGNQYIAELRDVNIQKDRMRFRSNMERLGAILAYRISEKLDFEDREVETPLGMAEAKLPSDKLVLGTILRAGLSMHQGCLSVFDHADNAFVSAYRKHHKDGTFEINVEYVSCPSIHGKVLIMTDPMLATGASMVVSVKQLLEYGTPKAIHIVTAIAAESGINYVRRNLPQAKIWAGVIDDELTAKSYIVPGLGDAGDLAFGEKLQD